MKAVIIFLLLGYNNEVPVKDLQKEINQFYSIDVQVRYAKMPDIAYYKPRNRYKADSILKYLSSQYPGQRVIAITSKDISTSAYGYSDWGIMGLGSLVNNVSVTSTYRLKNKNVKDRLTKVILHEIGHSYGINHCKSGLPCLMQAGDHTVNAIDKEPKSMCSYCKSKKKV